MNKLQQFLSGKFQRDVLWNLASLAVVGISGIALNYLIAVLYDVKSLGVFNQVFAIYIFFSQFAVMGVHQSTLKYVAEYADSTSNRTSILVSALAVTTILGSLAALACWGSSGIMGDLLSSPGVTSGQGYVALGLLFFALNKVVFAHLNGTRRMKAFAFFQALRVVLMLLSLGVLAWRDAPSSMLPFVLTLGELGTFVGSLLAVVSDLRIPKLKELVAWSQKHTAFGVRGFLSGVMMELNTRVDILMLGYFGSDTIVGIYSFAAICAEGFFQLLIILRNNYNPILVELLAGNKLQQLGAAIAKGKRMTYLLMTGMGFLAILGYYIVVPLVTTDSSLAQSWVFFAILVVGITLSSGYQPFSQILLQAGLPGWHTIMMLGVVVFNGLANLALIQLWGAAGAAVATASAFVFTMLLLRQFSSRLVGIRI